MTTVLDLSFKTKHTTIIGNGEILQTAREEQKTKYRNKPENKDRTNTNIFLGKNNITLINLWKLFFPLPL